MDTLMKGNHTLEQIIRDPGVTFFGRTIDDVLGYDFLNSPDAYIREEQDSYRLEIAVPGMSRKDITIQVDGAVLWVSAQKQEKNNVLNATEFNSKHFRRSFVLPEKADTNNIKAKCRNGLLIIHIRKIKTKATRRVIKIRHEETSAAVTYRMTSWWHKLKDRAHQLLAGKH